MKYNQLGSSNLQVSEICLGTMTFGEQNTVEEAHQQLDLAVDAGINFIDAAEMYPVPAKADTQGRTESYIGKWLSKQQRANLIVATKVSGPTARLPWIRGKDRRIDRRNIKQAVDDSLQRLQTDYIDLYQIHWPDRYLPKFGRIEFDPKQDWEAVPIAEQLEVFADLVQAGKIRYVGLSNESAWGICQFSHLASRLNLPKIVSIQNAYSLVNRVFDGALAEACYHENVQLLAYSPLAFGHLTGKYLQETPANSRIGKFPEFGGRYQHPNLQKAVAEYVELAKKYNVSPAVLALAFVRSRWFVASTIIGATTLEQLRENLSSLDVEITPEMLEDINDIHNRYPNPAP